MRHTWLLLVVVSLSICAIASATGNRQLANPSHHDLTAKQFSEKYYSYTTYVTRPTYVTYPPYVTYTTWATTPVCTNCTTYYTPFGCSGLPVYYKSTGRCGSYITTLSSPSNDAAEVSLNPTFRWSQVPGNIGYRVIVSTDLADLPADPRQPVAVPTTGFKATVSRDTTSYASAQPLSAGTKYYCAVLPLMRNGVWSCVTSFTTAPAGTLADAGKDAVVPTPTGSLSVKILPADAASAGGQWSVDGSCDIAGGTTLTGLTVGQHTVSFTPADGWTAPINETVTIVADKTAALTGTYTGNVVTSIGNKFLGATTGKGGDIGMFICISIAMLVVGRRYQRRLSLD